MNTNFAAEKFLEGVELQKNYPVLLLTLIDKDIDLSIRVAGAVAFKNLVKRNWKIVSVIIDYLTWNVLYTVKLSYLLYRSKIIAKFTTMTVLW